MLLGFSNEQIQISLNQSDDCGIALNGLLAGGGVGGGSTQEKRVASICSLATGLEELPEINLFLYTNSVFK